MIIDLALIRDGAPASPESPFQSADAPLSECGRDALVKNKRGGVYPAVSRAYTAPSARCVETAVEIYRLPVVLPGISRYDYGGLEGMEYRKAAGSDIFRSWAGAPYAGAVGGGSAPYAVQQGNIRIFREIISELAGYGLQSAALVAHHTVIMIIINRFLAQGFLYFYEDIPYGGGYAVTFDTETEILRIKNKLINF
ncbi:MAG: histidine phosphatase family protein [Oscillospiraceae bacterium]|nr:histidine phosphatase family protein [Oscillospiraceae bacterium]